MLDSARGKGTLGKCGVLKTRNAVRNDTSRRGLIGKASDDRPGSQYFTLPARLVFPQGSAIISLCFNSTHLVLKQARRHPEEGGAPLAARVFWNKGHL